MEKQALLLSSWYLPLRTVRWQLAVKLVYEERVDTLAHYDEQISSPSVTWNIPAVIRYRRGATSKRQKVRFSRGNVFLRDGYVCQYCDRQLCASRLTLDHVVPRSHGGTKTWENIVTACLPCNAKKSNLSCDEAGMFPANEPIIPPSLPLVPRRFGLPQIPTQWVPFLDGWT
jgi:5-methylcytosine-specific restriction endonuclease McrA